VSAVLQSGSPDATQIHYARGGAGGAAIICGVASAPRAPASNWLYVTCRECLRIGGESNFIARSRLAQLAKANDRTPPVVIE
jgi:hypothetical protein